MYSVIKRDDNVAYNVNEYINDLDFLPNCAQVALP